MMGRNVKIGLVCLVIGVIVGLISFGGLHRRVKRLAETQSADEKARHEVLAPPISTPTDVTAKAEIFWASAPDSVSPVEVELPLSADPVERSKQLLRELIADPPSPDQRTLPADATLLDFYLLPDGTAVADFSDTVASEMPSGILSEQLAVDSIARTLEINVPALAAVENSDSWRGSRYACGQRGSDRLFRFELASKSGSFVRAAERGLAARRRVAPAEAARRGRPQKNAALISGD